MNEETINMGAEKVEMDDETKKIVDELREKGFFESKDSWAWLLMLLFIGFATPFGRSDSSSIDKQFAQIDKQQIAYLSGKIEAYEKMLRGE